MHDHVYRLRLQAARRQVQHRVDNLSAGFVDLDLAIVHYKRLATEAEERFGKLAANTALDDGG